MHLYADNLEKAFISFFQYKLGLHCLRTSSPKKIERVSIAFLSNNCWKYFNNSQLKLLNFQTPLSRTALTDINNRLLDINRQLILYYIIQC